MPHCRTVAYPIGSKGNYYAQKWGTTEPHRRRNPTLAVAQNKVDCGQRVPVPNYPGIYKMAGKEVFAIKTEGMEEERIVKSWRTVLRILERANDPSVHKPAVFSAAEGCASEPSPPLSVTRGRRSKLPPSPAAATAATAEVAGRRSRVRKRKSGARKALEGRHHEPSAPEADDDDSASVSTDQSVGGAAFHWTSEEDNALLIAMLRLGITTKTRIDVHQWQEITESVCEVRSRTMRQVRRRWDYLNPDRKDKNEELRKRRRQKDRLERAINQELVTLATDKDNTQTCDFFADAVADEDALGCLTLDDVDPSELALQATEPPIDSFEEDNPIEVQVQRVQTRVAKRHKRTPSEPELNVHNVSNGGLYDSMSTDAAAACTYRFADGVGLGLGRARSFSFSFAPDKRTRGTRRNRALLTVPIVTLPPAVVAPLHQNTITDYLFQRKQTAAASCKSPLFEALQAKKPTASAVYGPADLLLELEMQRM